VAIQSKKLLGDPTPFLLGKSFALTGFACGNDGV